MPQYLYIWVGAYWFSATSLSKWPPGGHIGFFGFRNNFTLALNINSKLQWQNTYVYWLEPIDFQWPHFLNGCLVAILDFSVSGWHGFGSVTQVCFGISVSNFMCMSFVAVGRSLTIVSYVAFKMAALWFWTMPPSPMGRGYPSRSLIFFFVFFCFFGGLGVGGGGLGWRGGGGGVGGGGGGGGGGVCGCVIDLDLQGQI